MDNIIEDLKFRGLIHQSTNLDSLEEKIKKEKITLYVGFDPSADSLHVGNLLPLLTLRRFQEAGHDVIALAGGGTGLIGDPSGKSEERNLNPEDQVEEWTENIREQIEKLIDFDSNNAEMVNNYDWLGNIKAISFLRDIGKNFSINSMLAKESVKSRLELGISFTEFSYQILQSYDFLKLFRDKNCKLQIGGSDQWGNITAGVDLIRRVEGEEVYGLTVPLVVNSDGTKFGKTAGNAIWLDLDKTSPYQFYQFWINTSDDDVIKFLKYFTFLSKEDIEELEKQVKENPAERKAQKVLARETTTLIHGEEKAKQAEKISQALFYGNIKDLSKSEIKMGFQDVPSYNVEGEDKLELVDFLKEAGVVSSKRQAREDVKNGAIYINGEKQEEVNRILKKDDRLYDKYLVIRRGKKKYYLLKWS